MSAVLTHMHPGNGSHPPGSALFCFILQNKFRVIGLAYQLKFLLQLLPLYVTHIEKTAARITAAVFSTQPMREDVYVISLKKTKVQ